MNMIKFLLTTTILTATPLVIMQAAERMPSSERAPNVETVVPTQQAHNSPNLGSGLTVVLGTDTTIQDLQSLPVDGHDGGRFRIGAGSLWRANKAITFIKGGQMSQLSNMDPDQLKALLICVTVAYNIADGDETPKSLTESTDVTYTKDFLIGNNGIKVDIAELKAAFETLNAYYRVPVQTQPTHREPFSSSVLRPELDAPQAASAQRAAHDLGSPQAELLPFLKFEQTDIPAIVQELVAKGIHYFAQPQAILPTARKREAVDSGRFRQNIPWIEETFGQPEDQIVQALQTNITEGSLPPLRTWTVKTIDDEYKATAIPAVGAVIPEFIVVSGVGVSGLHTSVYGKDAVVQLASQFNYLESPRSTAVVPVSSYPRDRTQGPLAAVEAAAATLYRHAAVTHPTKPLPHALTNVIPDGKAPYYQNGYLQPLQCDDQAKLLDDILKNIGNLSILPQWVINEASGTRQMHVFTAAPACPKFKRVSITDPAGQICLQLVAAQYEAIAKLAVMRSVATGQTVPLHLTQVGQGVFSNPPAVMIEAMKRVAHIVKGFNVQVYVHVHSGANQFKQLNSANQGLLTFKDMDSKTFLKAAPLSSEVDDRMERSEKDWRERFVQFGDDEGSEPDDLGMAVRSHDRTEEEPSY